MHLGMLAALIGTGPARRRTGLERGAGVFGVVAGVPRQHTAGSAAYVSAIQTGANALDQVGDPGFAQARISARGTGLGAVEAFIDTSGQRRAVNTTEVGWVGSQHLLYMGHHYLPSSMLDVVRAYPLGGEGQRPPSG
jgi:hypothetical protein